MNSQDYLQSLHRIYILLFHLLDACALLFVGIVGQFEVLCNIVIPGCLLNLNLFGEFEDLLLQLGDCLLCALGVWGAIVNPGV